jgi:hypothetical protein
MQNQPKSTKLIIIKERKKAIKLYDDEIEA